MKTTHAMHPAVGYKFACDTNPDEAQVLAGDDEIPTCKKCCEMVIVWVKFVSADSRNYRDIYAAMMRGHEL